MKAGAFVEYRWTLMALAAATGWGLQYALTEGLMKTVKASDWVIYYFIGGALVCVLYSIAARRPIPLPGKNNAAAMGICVLVGLVAQYCIISAILSRNATKASLLENTVPLFAFLFAGLLFGKWEINGRMLIGSALMGGGLILIGTSSTR